MKSIPWIITAVILSAAIGNTASAQSTLKHRYLEPIGIGQDITDLAVTPDDRFVVVLAGDSILFLDTWDFALLDSSTGEPFRLSMVENASETPLCISVSPDGERVYAGLDTGYLHVYQIVGLEQVVPHHPANITSTYTGHHLAVTSGAIESIITLESLTPTEDAVYILMGVPSQSRLYWARSTTVGAIETPVQFPGAYQVEALARGNNYGFALVKTGTGYQVEAISCSAGVGCGPQDSLALAGNTLMALAADPVNDEYAVVGNVTNNTLRLLPAFPLILGDGLTPLTYAVEAEVMETQRASGVPSAVVADGGYLYAYPLSTSSIAFDGIRHQFPYNSSDPDSVDFTSLAASRPRDEYLFAGSTAWVYPFTENPEIRDLRVVGDPTVVTDGFTLRFSVDLVPTVVSGASYVVAGSFQFRNWTPVVGSGLGVKDGDSVAVAIDVNNLVEGRNILTVVVTDEGGRKGRDAISIEVDTIPPAVSFNLGFGDGRIIVDFTALDRPDVARYEIFYGATDAQPLDDYTVLDQNFRKFVVTSFTPGSNVEKVIDGLTNGVLYYVQVVVVDDKGNKSIGTRKSIMPQPIRTLTDLTHEDGSGGCLGSVGPARPAGDPRNALLFLVPALIVAGSFIYRRFTR